MGRYEFDAACNLLEKLAQRAGDDPEVLVNLAIARLNRQQSGDLAAAARMLRGVADENPAHLRARYCLGLLLLYEGDPAAALQHFQRVAQADPRDAFAAYFIGQCLFQLHRPADALAWYRRASEANANLRSAYYGAAQALRQLDRQQDADHMLDVFRQMADRPTAQLAEFKYTRMGPKAEVIALGRQPDPPARIAGPPLADPVPLPVEGRDGWSWSDDLRGATITCADIDGDGQWDLFLTGVVDRSDGGRGNLILWRRGDRYQADASHSLAGCTAVNAALWGDFDNDGRLDVYLCRQGPNQLWRQGSDGSWEDVTLRTGTAGGDHNTRDGALVDFDHDGDLDLLLLDAEAPPALLNNNRDGTFRPLSEDVGFAADPRPARGLVIDDFDRDRDADIILLNQTPPHAVWLNQRGWQYQPAGKAWDTFRQTPLDAALAVDADADGQVEVYAASAGGLWRWVPDAEGVWSPRRLADWNDAGNGTLCVADIHGQGRLSLLGRSDRGFQAIGLPAGQPESITSLPAPAAWSMVWRRAEEGPALLGLVPGQGPVIWGGGTGRGDYAAVAVVGASQPGEQTRSNTTGIGTRVACRVADRWTVLSTYRTQTGPGQSVFPLSFGLGNAAAADFLQLLWSDGVLQTELDLAGRRLHRIVETQRQLSSCPVLFAWDGQGWRFVTDLLGVGGLGFALAPGEYAPARPWENVLLPAGTLRPRGNHFVLKLAEPMEEICYLDGASLLVYDLPPGWDLVLDERLAVGPPQATGRTICYRRRIAPRRATNDRGADITETVAQPDGQAAPPGVLDPRFVGRTEEHWVELVFDRPLDTFGETPVLVADGWIEYPYSQTMFAAWQAGAEYQAPSLEARRGDAGSWQTVYPRFGYPAGMPRRMALPLADLPPGTDRLRLRTNMEVYWDTLAVVYEEAPPAMNRRRLPLVEARLAETGFPRRQKLPQRRTHFDYRHRDPLADMRFPNGFYTRFGIVTPLLEATDDAVAIFGPGEEVELTFHHTAGAVPPGWTRRFVLETCGWCKDMDLYTQHGETVRPLPRRDRPSAAHDTTRHRLHREYNTRFRAGY